MGNTLFFVVDASGSMGARRRMNETKGALLSLLLDAYQRRDRAALLAFRGEDAPGRFFEVGEYFLHVRILGDERRGDRPPLWRIHGFDVRGGARWKRVAEILSKDRPVYVPDLLGFGHSQRVAVPTHNYSHAGQAALLARLIEGMGTEAVDVAASPMELGSPHSLPWIHRKIEIPGTLSEARNFDFPMDFFLFGLWRSKDWRRSASRTWRALRSPGGTFYLSPWES